MKRFLFKKSQKKKISRKILKNKIFFNPIKIDCMVMNFFEFIINGNIIKNKNL